MSDVFRGKQITPSDPLTKREAAPDPQLQLARIFSAAADGCQASDVINAAANLIINGMRQTYSDRSRAESEFTEIFGRTKQALLDHYDSVTGKRKNIFPHTQVISPQPFVNKAKF